MSPSSVLFEESSDWNPKAVRKRLMIPQDQLIKLNSIPGWAKVQDDQNTFRLDKDFSIASSQSEGLVHVAQNKRIEENTKLFDEQIINRKLILESHKAYRSKLTRSLSLSSINKSCENLKDKTLKRTLSLQSVCQSTKENYKIMDSPTATEKPTAKENNGLPSDKAVPELTNQSVKPVVESTNDDSIDLSSETSKAENGMVHNIALYSKVIGHSNGVLPAGDPAQSSNAPDQFKHATESMNDGKSDSHSETVKANGVFPVIECSSTSHESMKTNGTLNEANSTNSVKNQSESDVPVEEDTIESDFNNEKEIQTHTISVFAQANTASSLNVQEQEQTPSHLPNRNERSSLIATETAASSTSITNSNDNLISNRPENTLPSASISDECSIRGLANGSVNITSDDRDYGINLFTLGPRNTNTATIMLSTSFFGNPDALETEVIIRNCNPIVVEDDSTSDEKMIKGKNSDKKMVDEGKDSDKKVAEGKDSDKKVAEGKDSDKKVAEGKDSDKKVAEGKDSDMKVAEGKDSDEKVAEGKDSDKKVVEGKDSDKKVMEGKDSNKKVMEGKGSDDEKMNEKKKDSDDKEMDDKKKDSDEKKIEGTDKSVDPVKSSVNGETSSAKKRKLESRNKRSKRHKSVEKHGTLKIRSIKKVGEIHYSVEEVKTMLDIMKQFS